MNEFEILETEIKGLKLKPEKENYLLNQLVGIHYDISDTRNKNDDLNRKILALEKDRAVLEEDISKYKRVIKALCDINDY